MPTTVPVEVTDIAPRPLFCAKTPSVAPVTFATLTLIFKPVLLFCAAKPLLLVPVTDPVAVTASEPVPLFVIFMPNLPETEAAAMVRFVPKFRADIP